MYHVLQIFSAETTKRYTQRRACYYVNALTCLRPAVTKTKHSRKKQIQLQIQGATRHFHCDLRYFETSHVSDCLNRRSVRPSCDSVRVIVTLDVTG
jgi:hypothetical protein